ncbi:MAG: DUF3618 domain-containing protein, partial [Oxalobacteraceae bacterium]
MTKVDRYGTVVGKNLLARVNPGSSNKAVSSLFLASWPDTMALMKPTTDQLKRDIERTRRVLADVNDALSVQTLHA